MAKKSNLLSRVRLVRRRSKPLTKMAVAVVIILSIAALISLGAAQHSTAERLEALREKASHLAGENERLRENIAILGTPASVEQIAMDELDMARPGTVFFQPEK